MSLFSILGGHQVLPSEPQFAYEQRMASFALSRVLEFTGHTLDELINDPYARYEVVGYYKLYRFIASRCEELPERPLNNEDGKVLL